MPFLLFPLSRRNALFIFLLFYPFTFKTLCPHHLKLNY
nr:MAG TPA: hypothetical protein [Caudoviricetes sp.]